MSARVDVAELLARARARGAAGDLEAAALAPRSAETRYALGRVSQILAGPGDAAFACRWSARELQVLTVDHRPLRARVRLNG